MEFKKEVSFKIDGLKINGKDTYVFISDQTSFFNEFSKFEERIRRIKNLGFSIAKVSELHKIENEFNIKILINL